MIRIIAEEPRSFGTGVHLNRNIRACEKISVN